MKKDNMTLPTELRSAVTAIKQAILKSQYRAAKTVNREQLSLYFGIGRYISEHTRQGYWGTGAIERISEQLQKELPGLRGFSGANLKFMRQFYESWEDLITRQKGNDSKSIAAATDLKNTDSIDVQILLPVKRLPTAIDFAWDEFVGISFSHHMEILHKVAEIDERLFYIHQTFLTRNPQTKHDIIEAVVEAGKKRVRPAAMTTATTLIALLPVLSSTGKGADVMVPMSIPTFGGMLIQTMTMFVVPVLQCWWRENALKKKQS